MGGVLITAELDVVSETLVPHPQSQKISPHLNTVMHAHRTKDR
jgi:hypothetical protein